MRHSPVSLLFFFLFSSFFLPFVVADDLTITGRLLFEGGQPIVPPGSFYYVELRDISLMDAPSEVLDVYIGEIDKIKENNTFSFTLTLKEEERRKRTRNHLAISAVLNRGWQRQEGGDEWIRKGDYSNEYIETVHVPKEGNTINNFLVHMRQYNY